MNSLNILSSRVSPPPTPSPSRSNSTFGLALSLATANAKKTNKEQNHIDPDLDDIQGKAGLEEEDGEESALSNLPAVWQAPDVVSEKSYLLNSEDEDDTVLKRNGNIGIFNHVTAAINYSISWMLCIMIAPFKFIASLFYDSHGHFAPLRFLQPGSKSPVGTRRAMGNASHTVTTPDKSSNTGRRSSMRSESLSNSAYSSALISSESESEKEKSTSAINRIHDIPSKTARSLSTSSSDDVAPVRRSIRIKLNNNDAALRERKHRRTGSATSQSNGSGGISSSDVTVATLKSPTSPAAASLSLTKYPRAPAPPRPLIPPRTPSYTFDPTSGKRAQKTLVLDLDETLIHSMARGGRMSSGHMVEVNLNSFNSPNGQSNAAPQHPILYYVHKRPYCDEFLRRVCKWYNLVIFTASVQEYADPVIDWLEQERKFFSGRFYRQHCTYRHGAFIKDLSSVEPDLSKVMILDNSPLSYMFHQDNAIAIEGWISDPTDNDLLHLVPLLEGLQYVTDVRALLALRGGEDGKHT